MSDSNLKEEYVEKIIENANSKNMESIVNTFSKMCVMQLIKDLPNDVSTWFVCMALINEMKSCVKNIFTKEKIAEIEGSIQEFQTMFNFNSNNNSNDEK